MPELSNGGGAAAAVTSSASTRPSASASVTRCGASGARAARIRAWYASTVIRSPGRATSGWLPRVTAGRSLDVVEERAQPGDELRGQVGPLGGEHDHGPQV